MKRRYVTVDVFTDRMFGGNPLAVVLALVSAQVGGRCVEMMEGTFHLAGVE